MDKGELIDKGTGGITKLTASAHYKTLAFCLVFSILGNCWQAWNNSKLTDRLINTNETLNEKRIEELKSIVKGEVGSQLKPVIEKVDTIKQTADSTFRNINSKLP